MRFRQGQMFRGEDIWGWNYLFKVYDNDVVKVLVKSPTKMEKSYDTNYAGLKTAIDINDWKCFEQIAFGDLGLYF